MIISILCSDIQHPVYPHLIKWRQKHLSEHQIQLISNVEQLSSGDILFLISCHEIIKKDLRDRYTATLVLHASDLPKGRGWSPHIWQILEGHTRITISLLEAENEVDSGAIWKKVQFQLQGHELFEEINTRLFYAELELMDFAVQNFKNIKPQKQITRKYPVYRKRSPEDSRLDPDKSIAEQFNLLRVADPARYPAFIDYLGHRYKLSLEKVQAEAVWNHDD